MTNQFWIGYTAGVIVGALSFAIDGFWFGILIATPVLLVAVILANRDENKTSN